MAGKFELKRSVNDQFVFNLKAANARIILTSELYSAKADARTGIALVRSNAANSSNYERKMSRRSEPYFVLKASNGQIVGTSEMYLSIMDMENGITSVKTNAPDAVVEDLTT